MVFPINPHDAVREGIKLLNFINKATGWDKFGSEPYIDTIKLLYTDSREEDEITFYDLFYRLPPFEPIAYPDTSYGNAKFTGDRLWVLDVVEMINHGRLKKICRSLKRSMCIPSRYDYSIEGVVRGDRVKLTHIIVFRTIGDLDGTLTLRFIKDNKYYIIQYGFSSETINVIKRDICKEIGCVDERFVDIISKKWKDIEKAIMQRYTPRYDINILNYITYCYNGRYITTDPIIQYMGGKHIRCPPCRNQRFSRLFICKDFPGLGRFHYSRKIFPKVYVNIEPEIIYSFNPRKSPLTIDIADKIRIISQVSRLTLYLPGNNILELEPGIKPYTDLVRTRGLIVYIGKDFVKAIISYLLDVDKKLLRILATKYIVLKTSIFRLGSSKSDTGRGILDHDQKRIEFYAGEEPIIDLVNDILKTQNIFSESFVDYVGSVLMHTISHLLLMELSRRLGIDPNKLSYVYGAHIIGNGDKVYFAAIVEKDKYGTIMFDRAIRELLQELGEGDYERGFYRLLKDINNYVASIVKKYEREYRAYIKENECSLLSSDLNDLEKKVLEFIIDIIVATRRYLESNNVYPDFSIFKHIIVSLLNTHNTEVYGHIINWIMYKLKGEIKDKYELQGIVEDIIERKLESLLLCYGPDYCLDGCSLDIHLEKDCTKAMTENLETSRRLFEAFARLIGISEDVINSPVKGITIYRLITTARKSLSIETSHTNDQAIDALTNLLEKGVRVHITIDKRIIKEVEDRLRKLKNMYGDRFTYKESERLMHYKTYVVDDTLRIETSWNYSTASNIEQGMIIKNLLV